LYQALLLPLENVKQSRKYHPEGDVLYHSLQVFDLAREALFLGRRQDEALEGFGPCRVAAGSWEELARLQAGARERGAEGLMLKRLASPYRVGRRRGDWWKWKGGPSTGHGGRVDRLARLYRQPNRRR